MNAHLAGCEARIGEVFVSPWMRVDQAMIDRFADATLDRQFIHIDPERAASTAFGGTVAHGFLTLSLLPHLMERLPRSPSGMSVNYGLDRLRFVHPVRAGSNIRAVWAASEAAVIGENQVQCRYNVTVEIEGQSKPALAAVWITRLIF